MYGEKKWIVTVSWLDIVHTPQIEEKEKCNEVVIMGRYLVTPHGWEDIEVFKRKEGLLNKED